MGHTASPLDCGELVIGDVGGMVRVERSLVAFKLFRELVDEV